MKKDTQTEKNKKKKSKYKLKKRQLKKTIHTKSRQERINIF